MFGAKTGGKQIKTAALLLCAVFLCACGKGKAAEFVTTDGGETYQQVSDNGEKKTYIADEIVYEVPAEWTHKNDGYTGFFHYPADGGLLYVMGTNWAPVELWYEKDAYKILHKSVADMEELAGVLPLGEVEEAVFGNKFSLGFDFEISFAEGSFAKGYALLFVHESYVYKFIFTFANETEKGELEIYKDEIINSII